MTRIALVPGCLALLPEYASLVDPVAELRTACLDAVSWLGADVQVITSDHQGRRIAAELVTRRRRSDGEHEPSYLVVANGSACRTERAPGYLDARSLDFDRMLGKALIGPDPEALRALDHNLAQELWADVQPLSPLAGLLEGASHLATDHDGAPFGVQYWVMRWQR